MRRWTSLGVLTAVTACTGGARDVGRAQIQRTATPTGPVATVTRPAPDAPREEAPALMTLNGRAVAGIAPVAVTAPPASAAVPPGGYVVRTPGAVARGSGGDADEGAPPPMVRSEPTSVTERHRDLGGGGGLARNGISGGPARSGSSVGSASGGGRAASPPMAPRMRAPATTASGGFVAARPSVESFRRAPARPTGGSPALDMAVASEPSVAPPSAPAMHDRIAVMPAAPPSAGPTTHVTIAIGTSPVTVVPAVPVAPPPPPPPDEDQAQATAGLLTAGSVGDVDRRDNYLEYLTRHGGEREHLGLDMTRRVRFRVLDAQNHPVNYARINLAGPGIQFSARTHADGYWDFFPGVTAPGSVGAVHVTADVEGVGAQATVELPQAGDLPSDVVLQLPAVVQAAPPVLDLGFAIDVTGSMGDELRYVNREVASIVHRIESQAQGVRVRVGATFYRDRFDDAVVQQIPFSSNVAGFAAAMQGVTASGGGDYPEDMNAGLEAAMTRMGWSDGAAIRVLVVIADAPPQMYGDEQYRYTQAMSDAARRGIRILPVAASGADRNVEYLFRAMGAFTSTPYVYLTDDSGVGGGHMEADTDRVAIERFNDLLTRLVLSDLRGQGMHEPGPLGAPQS